MMSKEREELEKELENLSHEETKYIGDSGELDRFQALLLLGRIGLLIVKRLEVRQKDCAIHGASCPFESGGCVDD